MKRDGFTLVELLLSVSIITILAGLSLPLFVSFQTRNDVDVTTQEIVGMLRRAQVYAEGVVGDSQWGVRVAPTSATLFKGASYATRDSGFDETAVISNSTTPSGLGEVVFAKFTATPSSTGSIILTSTSNDTRTITLGAKGVVDY